MNIGWFPPKKRATKNETLQWPSCVRGQVVLCLTGIFILSVTAVTSRGIMAEEGQWCWHGCSRDLASVCGGGCKGKGDRAVEFDAKLRSNSLAWT